MNLCILGKDVLQWCWQVQFQARGTSIPRFRMVIPRPFKKLKSMEPLQKEFFHDRSWKYRSSQMQSHRLCIVFMKCLRILSTSIHTLCMMVALYASTRPWLVPLKPRMNQSFFQQAFCMVHKLLLAPLQKKSMV